MIKISWLLLLFIFPATIIYAQNKPLPLHPEIEKALKDIKEFQEKEAKQDSAASHPLGSNTEEDFLRRYIFYKEVYSKLKAIEKEKLLNSDQVNLELLQYSIDDKLSEYKYKAYLNPILADEGFHTGLAHIASELVTSKKEFNNYISRLMDIPRYVDEQLA